jgi:CBS domain-containing protein
MASTVRQMLQAKGNQVFSVNPQTSVYEALEVMSRRDIGALLVMNGSQLAGIFSERDYARKIILMGRVSRETPVDEVMTREVVGVAPAASVDDCMNLMTQHRIRHLPVLQGAEVLGMISIGDVVKAIISEQQFRIGQLEEYISGGR